MPYATMMAADETTGAERAVKVTANGEILQKPTSSSFLNIAGAATTLVKSGAGVLDRIIFNKLVATGVITIYDSLSASGTKIGTVTNPAALLSSQLSLPYGVAFSIGLTIVTSAADDLTVAYR